MSQLRLAIVAASWDTQIMDGLPDGALRAAKMPASANPRSCGFRQPSSFRSLPRGWHGTSTQPAAPGVEASAAGTRTL